MTSSSFTHLFALFLTVLLLSRTTTVDAVIDVQWVASEGGNGHYYRSLDITVTPVTYPEAVSACTTDTTSHPGLKGYLATVTSDAEWNFLLSNQVIKSDIVGAVYWLSGLQTSPGTWSYDAGPEANQLMYNLFQDRCYGFCPFGGLEPGMKPGENYIYTSYDSIGNIWWNNDLSTTGFAYNYVCEFGGMEKPFISQAPVDPGLVTLRNLQETGFTISTLSVSFLHISTGVSQTCSGSSLGPNSYTCSTSEMTGAYLVNITDGTTSAQIPYRPQSPFVAGVYTGFNAGDRVTVMGNNFGSTMSKIQVWITNSSIPCTLVSLQSKSLVCTLSQTIPNNLSFLPIKVSVDGISTTSYKTPVYCIDRFYSSSYFDYDYTNSKSLVETNYLLGSQKGYIATVSSAPLFQCLMKSLPKLFKNVGWDFWQGVNYVGSNITSNYIFEYNSGPLTGENMTFPSTFSLNISQISPTAPVTLYMDNQMKISFGNANTNTSVLVAFGGKPKWEIPQQVIRVPTNGSIVTLSVDDIGTQYITSSVLVTLKTGTISTNIQIMNFTYTPGQPFQKLNVMIPPGYNTQHSLAYSVDTRFTGDNLQFIDYQAPIINQYIPNRPSTRGDTITFTGIGFYTDLSVTKAFANDKLLTCLQSTYTSVVCILPSGVGSINGNISVGAQTTSFNSFFYAQPTVQGASISGREVLIQGSNLGDNSSSIVIMIGTLTCPNVVIVTDHTAVKCILPASTAAMGTVSVTLTVGGQASTGAATVYIVPQIVSIDRKPLTTGDNITIIAYYAKQSPPATLLFMNFTSGSYISLVYNYQQSNTADLYYCTIPKGLDLIQLVLQSNSYNSTPFNTTYQEPIVQSSTSISKGQPGLITITGKSFGIDNNNSSIGLSFSVSVQDVPCTSLAYVSLTNSNDPAIQKLQCLYDASVDDSNIQGKSLNVTVKVSQLIGVNQVFIYNPSQKVGCPNNCSNHGTCNYNFGDCLCDSGYELNIDCSIFTDPNNNNNNQTSTPTTNTQAETSMTFESSKAINFTTSIRFIREVDVDDSSLKVISMENVQWTIDSNTSTYYGKLSNETVEFEVKVTPYTNATTIEFAGQPLQMTPNSVKYHIRISNYTWTSMLSTLQVIFLSESDSLELDACGSPITTIQQNEGDSIYWTKIRVGQTLLNTKFASRMILDNRIVQTTVISLDENDALQQLVNDDNPDGLNVLTAITLFHFGNEAEIDPAFSALLVEDNDIKNDGECGDEGFATWKIITIVVVCGVAIIAAGVTVFLVKRKQIRLHFTKRVNTVSMKRMP